MSRALYLFVREGVSKDIEPKPRGGSFAGAPTTSSPHEDKAEIIIGEEGGDKVFPYWLYGSISVETGYTETKRNTTTKRVENPDDPSQYVNVEQIDKLYAKSNSNPTDQISLTLKNPK